ncbi:MAG: ABC transporter permease, partial [Deltaproteobacteria bacterium]|nr:ABC transporter permease [Deltaproteobacteria bacterium]
PGRLLGTLGTPLLFWLLLGSGFGSSMRLGTGGASGGTEYLTYFFPGTLLLVVLFTGIFSSMSVILDRRDGFLLGVLAAPVSRVAIVLGKVAGGTVLGLLQGGIMLLLSPLAGLVLTPGTFLAACGVILLTSLGLSALGFLAAWRMDSVQSFHAVMNLLLMPMWLLSGAFFPASGASTWVWAVMMANPLTHGLTALRAALEEGSASAYGGLPPGESLAILAGFAVAMVALCAWRVGRAERG